MEHKPTQTILGDGISFTSIIDSKFKRNRISVRAVFPLHEDTVAAYAIVPLLLRKGCKSYPDFTALNARLSELYGASLSTNTGRFNGYQVITLSINGLDNRYALENEDIVAECTQLLTELLFEPVLDENGHFPSEDVALERQYLIDTIKAEINDKRTYAQNELVYQMNKGTPLATPRYGTVESAESITPASATAAWKQLLSTAQLSFFFTGSGDPKSSRTAVEAAVSSLERSSVPVEILRFPDRAEKVTQLSQVMDVQQGILMMGFRVADLSDKKKMDAARLMSSIYGGSPFSKLFINVRERLSLCYYCSSLMDTTNQIMLVGSGIETENKEKAEAEILHQLKAMQTGDFTDEELEQSILLMASSLGRVSDTPGGLEGWYFQRSLLKESYSPQEDLEDLQKITKDDIINVAQGITLDTVYFLKGPNA